MWGSTALCARLASLTGPPATAWRWLRIALTFHCVCLAWCFFRLTLLPDSLICVRKWFEFDWDKALIGGSADFRTMAGAHGICHCDRRRAFVDAARAAAGGHRAH